GVDRFLFVYGDKPTAGSRTSELTVRTMIAEARGAAEDPAFAGCGPFGVGVTSGLRPVPAWKAAADFTFVQVSFSVDALLRWRESTSLQIPVYAGVMVLASAGMARSLASAIPDIEIPGQLIDDVERDRGAGVDAACEQILAIRDTGAFDGVHLVPVSRYREVAARLERDL
ncbi:MAG: methylenetetrahydrofolate reductase, partial [Streptosporangiaceae bacterium]